MSSKQNNDIFRDLFVLEIANNHWGDINRGIRIIQEHGSVARYNSVKAAIKLQIRDVDTFIHPDYKGNKDIRYIKKTEDTKMSKDSYRALISAIKEVSCIPMATAFDEKSVDLCVELDIPILKLASSDVNDWPLIERVAHTKLPVIISSGGASEKSIDDIVLFFERRNIPLAINHCVALYPSENDDLELNQIDYLINRYPEHVIGLSTHEYLDWQASMLISYAKGARTWERHVDIEADNIKVSPYCSLPGQIDTWLKAYHLAREMCGGAGDERRVCSKKEIEYLDVLVRGVYAKRDIGPGYVFTNSNFVEDFYLAIPLQKGQLSCREVINGEILTAPIKANEPLTINHIAGPVGKDPILRKQIENRGI